MLRRWVGVLAMLGVLLHAGALVRHHAVMLDAQLEHQALVADLHQLCNAGAIDPASLPDVPRPTDAQHGCPVCSGLASLFALAAPDIVFVPVRIEPVRYVAVAAVEHRERSQTFLPPVRGPPSLA